MQVSIHISHFCNDAAIEHGPVTARAADDSQYICTQLLIAGVDAEVVDGPVSKAPESAFWLVFEGDLQWHLASLGAARRERFVILRPSGPRTAPVGGEAAVITYAQASAWSESPTSGALATRGGQAPEGQTLAEQLVAYLRSLVPQVEGTEPPGPFPVGETFGSGAYRIEKHLQGEGLQKLFLGREVRSQTQLLVSFDALSSRVDPRAFQKTVSYESPGVFPLAFVGKVDFRKDIDLSEASSTWGLVERGAEGDWLPSILGTFDPDVVFEQESRQLPSHDEKTAIPDALSLGSSAGKILAAAAARDLLLTRVRPEYMWAARVDGRLEVTGLSARADAFFAMTRVDAVTWPVFDRYYYSPEEHSGDRDDRALVFSLAIMIAEWATGRFPYRYKFHDSGPLSGKHLKLAVPKPLARLLSRGMELDRVKRPDLRTFLVELEGMRQA